MSSDGLEIHRMFVRKPFLVFVTASSGRPVVVDDLRDSEEEVALFSIIEAMCPPETVFLGDTGYAEGLAREPSTKDVMPRNFTDSNFVNVAVRRLAKIRSVGLLAEFVIIRGKDTASACLLKGNPEAADSAEQVDEAQWVLLF